MHTRILIPILASILILPEAGCSSGGDESYRTISTTEAAELIRTDTSLVVLDVRTPGEFASETGHLQGALLLPVQVLERRIAELEPLKDRPILVYCRSGNRSRPASEALAAAGFTVHMLDGGILAWNDAGLPVVRETGGGMKAEE